MRYQAQQTSIEAYHDIKPRLGELQKTVLVYVSAYPDLTDKELAEKAGKADPADIRRRRGELVDMGLVVCSGKRVCTISGKKAMTWKVKP
jgi:hypothetical protein